MTQAFHFAVQLRLCYACVWPEFPGIIISFLAFMNL